MVAPDSRTPQEGPFCSLTAGLRPFYFNRLSILCDERPFNPAGFFCYIYNLQAFYWCLLIILLCFFQINIQVEYRLSRLLGTGRCLDVGFGWILE